MAERGSKAIAGVFWIIAIAESLLAVLAFVFFKRGKWKHAMV